MKNRRIILLIVIFSLLSSLSCEKGFLDKKPSTDIELLKTLSDLQQLLDNTYVFGKTGALPQISSDDYYITSSDYWAALPSATERNAYVWAGDLFGGEGTRLDWNIPFEAVFYANSVLDGLRTIGDSANTERGTHIRGSAFFARAYAYYDLVKNFCDAYDKTTASKDLGLPLRKEAGVDVTLPRSSLESTYQFILDDLFLASALLENRPFPVNNRNRPSKEATLAMLARVYLAMGVYSKAEVYADSSLRLYNKLIDYNDVCVDCTTPFSFIREEILYHGTQINHYGSLTVTLKMNGIAIDSTLIKSYDENDLRLDIFYQKNSIGNYNIKRGYISSGFYQFSGLATDEMYLIRAECRVRRGATTEAMEDINTLLRKRYKYGTYKDIVGEAPLKEALAIVLAERRKELVWRGLRWSDLKRLNKEGANTTLTRKINGKEYSLRPNDPRYVFPIPDDEIVLSGIQQNIR